MFGEQPFKTFTQGGVLWLEARKHCAWTATSPAKWTGVHPWCSRPKAYREAVDQQPKRDQDEWNLRWGRHMEPILREVVLGKYLNGRKFEETGLWVKKYNGRLIGASPDGLIGDDYVLEIKASVPARDGNEKAPVDRVPMHDIPQILMQMAMTDRRNCLYARYNGSSAIAVLLCEYDAELMQLILNMTEEFYLNNVKLRDPPKRYTMGGAEWLARQQLELRLMEYNRDKVRALPPIAFTHKEFH
jgi:predicted phage-related endonuclease